MTRPVPPPPAALVRAVLQWWEAAGARTARDVLPWRTERDPWKVLVAETMLAQTPVRRVVPFFTRFVDAYPMPAVLAAAPLAEVLAAWNGLGYNGRALRLREAARALVERHGGEVPGELRALLALPGVGPYTARAVLAFAFGADHGVVDANIGRVLARALAGRPLGAREAQEIVDGLVRVSATPAVRRHVGPARRAEPAGRVVSLALMDLGAICCRSRRPACDGCPLGGATRSDEPHGGRGASARRRSSVLCRWRAAVGGPGATGGPVIPDPARGSAATARPQSRFEGSDREARGRLLRRVLGGPLPLEEVGEGAGLPDDPARAERVLGGLVKEGVLRLGPSGLVEVGS